MDQLYLYNVHQFSSRHVFDSSYQFSKRKSYMKPNLIKYWNTPFPCPPTYFSLHNKYRLWSGWGIYEWFIANTPRCSRSAPIASTHPPFSQFLSFPWEGKPPTINKSVVFSAVVCRLLFGVRLMCAKFKARWFAGVADKLFTKFSTSPRKPFRSWA